MTDIGLDRVGSSNEYDFKKQFNDPDGCGDLYKDTYHVCSYYEPDQFHREFSQERDKFSTISLNIRSLPGKWNEFKDFINLINNDNLKFSVIALQEIWNVPMGINYNLDGYNNFEYRIRDPSGRDGNAGGGVGIWVDSDLEYTVLENLSVFEPHFFESLFIKIKTNRNKFTIIGNIYRPNTGPLADLKSFLEKLGDILNKIYNDPELKKCEDIQLIGDFNMDLLQYKTHNLTGQYVDMLLGNGLLPLITQPTRVFGRSATIIDHISSSYRTDLYRTGILLSCLSDHFPIFYVRNCNFKKILQTNKYIDIRKINN